MDTFLTPGDGMAREIKARVSHGKIELPEDIKLPEGEEVTILVKELPSSTPRLRFGMLPGAIIKGDIVSPLDDVEWDALK